MQVSYTGETQPDDRWPVLWPVRPEGRPERTQFASDDVPKLYDAVVSLAGEGPTNGEMAPKPWPAFLPPQISLQSPIVDAQRNRTWTLTHQISDWLNGDVQGLWPGVDWANEAMRPVAGLWTTPWLPSSFPCSLI